MIDESQCSISFIGNATTLLRFGDFTLLTDPNFVRRGQWVHIGHGIVTRRRTQPSMNVHELPDLDAVVLSHLHGDHFDRVARRGLHRDLPVFTTAHAARKLRGYGFAEAVPMPRWTQRSMSKSGDRLEITSLPGKHACGALAAVVPPVMGTLVEYLPREGDPLRVYLSGDTVLHSDLREITDLFPDIDVAVLHLGGTKVFGRLLTMDGGQGARLLDILKPAHTIPVHYDDYGVMKSPLSDFQVAVDQRPGVHAQYVHRGQTCPLPPT